MRAGFMWPGMAWTSIWELFLIARGCRVLEERFPNEISSCLDDASRMNEVQALVLM